MSGIVGFFDEACSERKGLTRLNRMASLLSHQSFFNKDRLFNQDRIYGSRVHQDVIQPLSQPDVNGHVNVWLDGEIYNRDEIAPELKNSSDPEFFNKMYQKHNNFSFLGDLDGIFSVVIYDSKKNKIHFVTDRYGFNFLYYYQNNRSLAWFSEAKGVLALDSFVPKINADAVHDFFTDGFLKGNKSWFQDVHLFPPATVMSWDVSRKAFTYSNTYWSWNEIQISNSQVQVDEVVERVGRLFKVAVRKRLKNRRQVCVPLSGGLDSRAILAAIPVNDLPVNTFTFGKKDCWDIKIARKVSQIKGANHHVIDLTVDNWFEKRSDGVWWTDGQMNLKHMHVLGLLQSYHRNFKISLNGFLGAATQGGYYLDDEDASLPEKMNNRGRRFINEGSRLGKAFGVFYRRPYVDNDLIEFTLSQPAHLRRKSQLFNKMLLQEFPDFFNSVPWQRTGFTISASITASILKRKFHALINRGISTINYLGIPYDYKKHYHNYPAWIRQSQDFIEQFLKSEKAIYPEYIDREQVYADWKAHLNGKDRSEKICAYLTFELFLQQVFEKKYRPKN